MLDILIYALYYIGATYAYMAVPCFIWHRYGNLGLRELLPFALFVMAPISWPLATFAWLLEGWFWLCRCVRKLIWDKD